MKENLSKYLFKHEKLNVVADIKIKKVMGLLKADIFQLFEKEELSLEEIIKVVDERIGGKLK